MSTIPLPGLADLGADDKSAQRLVAHAVAAWCADRNVEAAALYLPGERGLRREVIYGTRSFPISLPRVLPANLTSIELPGATLVHAAEGTVQPPQPDEPLWPLLLAALHIARLQNQLKQQHFEVSYRVVELEALYEVGLAIAGTLDLDSLSEGVLHRAVSLIDARRGALYLLDDVGRYLLSRTIGGEALPELATCDALAMVATAAVAEIGDEPADQTTAAAPLPGATHLLTVPIDWDAKPAGLLVVGDKESRAGVGPFTVNDRRTLSLFANQAAIAIENAHLHRQALEKERLEREMVLAGEIQRRILPKETPHVPGYEIAGWNRPARQIGGDYYDFLPLPGDHLSFTVGDVSGKGMPAALMVSTLHSALRLLIDRIGVGPELLGRLNQHIIDSSTPNKFITLLIAELDLASGALSYLNAGHNPGLLIRGARTIELPPAGVPLGLVAGARFGLQQLVVEQGDLLCLYSDGITEAAGADDIEFGERRLADLLREHLTTPLAELIQVIADHTEEFAGDRPQGDDQTLVLLRRTG